jgi:uncharacterized protein YjaZ
MFSIANMTNEYFNGFDFQNPISIPIPVYRKLFTDNELFALIIGVTCCYLIADFVAQIICEKIEARQTKTHSMLMQDLNYRDAELQSLLKENIKLKEELDSFKAKEVNLKKEQINNESPKQKIIQCDKCYNEYTAENIHTSYFIQKIKQQYCNECFYRLNTQQQIKKSQSDSLFKYIN